MKRKLLLLITLIISGLMASNLPVNYSFDDIEDMGRARARVRHLDFIKYAWQKKNEPLIVGQHTMAACGLIDQAMRDFKNGVSTFLKILICFRHGKSDLSSRYLPAHFLGQFPD